jgi:hypothetical protein
LVADEGARADVLRSAVVFLHATLEDLVRSSERHRLPDADPEVFKDLALPVGGAPDKPELKRTLSLVDLAAFRGKTVNDLFAQALDHRLAHSTYNNVGDVMGALGRIRCRMTLDDDTLKDLKARVDSMMRRRHQIAHRADAVPSTPTGGASTNRISAREVEDWTDAVKKFGAAILEALEKAP